MTDVDLTIGLVWAHGDGTFSEEPERVRAGDAGAAIAEARRDGIAGQFGRVFVGFSRVAAAAQEAPWEARRVSSDPTLPAPELERILAELGGRDAPPLPEPAVHPDILRGLDDVAWWSLEGAFGPSTRVGVHLRRCAAVDPAIAREAAHVVGEGIAHQSSLYPVTAAALPFVVELLGSPLVAARAELAGWLAVVATSRADASRSRASAWASRMAIRASWRASPEMRDDLLRSMERQEACARACAARLATLRPALEPLAHDGEIGDGIREILGRLAP